MIGRFLLVAVTSFLVSSCAVGDGMAHVVKLAVGGGKSSDHGAPAAPETNQPVAATAEPSPPAAEPPPITPLPPDSVKVETLPPSH
jgi:hypothetical protein